MTKEELYKVFKKHPKICTDTRKIEENSIFFALKGGNFNGNKFCEEALKKGCAFAVSDEIEGEKIIKVDNTLDTLQSLARYHRLQSKAKIIGITGSNGKTTTKEMMHSILSRSYNVLATKGNLNNHIGVPLTLLKLTEAHEIGIIEMGANRPGDIEELCEIALPDWGLITNIGKAHLEGFGSIETTLKTKAALYTKVFDRDGKIFLNADDPMLSKACLDRNAFKYGVHYKHLDLTGRVEEEHPYLKISWNNDVYYSSSVTTQLVGAYNLYNILAGISIATQLKMTPRDINEGIKSYTPQNHRSQIIETSKNILIMDAYNANPASMDAAIKSFIGRNAPNSFMIIGDMFELGEASRKEHQKIIDLVIECEIPALLIGHHFYELKSKQETIEFFKERKDTEGYLKQNQIEEKTILLKGSRGIGLEALEELL